MPTESDIPLFEDEDKDTEIVPGFAQVVPDEPIPQVDEPLVKAEPMRPWRVPETQGDSVEPQEILGPYDAYLAEVVQTNYAIGGDGLYGDYQRISARRCEVWYTTNNEPEAVDIPQVLSQPTPAIVEAMPWPLHHDMEKYHVAVGDIVTILEGRDGRRYFLADDEPFVGVVVDNENEGDDSETKEDFCGGAGNRSLRVRRRVLDGDPDGSGYGPDLDSDLLDANGAEIEYYPVVPVGPTGVAHGYRVGDLVWVHKRGRYWFCTPSRQGFLAVIVDEGPDEEADGTANEYWVKEVDWEITYTAGAADYTYAQTVRTAAVAGQSGSNGRWVMAWNLAHDPSHDLPVDESVTVWVNLTRDPDGAATAGCHGYVFYRDPDYQRWGKAIANSSESVIGWEVQVHPCDDIGGNNVDAGTTHVCEFDAIRGSHEAPNIREDQIVGYIRSNGVYLVNIGARWDLPIGAFRIWHDMANIPDGWAAVTDAYGRLLLIAAPSGAGIPVIDVGDQDGTVDNPPPWQTDGPSDVADANTDTPPSLSFAAYNHTHDVDPKTYAVGLIVRVD